MAFAHPEHTLSALHLAEGMRVVDLGTGSGAYALAAAKRVGHSGKVYAIDIQKELLATLKRAAEHAHLRNVEVVWGNFDELGGTKLADGIADAAILSNILFQSEHVANLAKETYRILRHGGKALVIDWSESFGNMGPTAGHVVKPNEAKLFFADAGFAFDHTETAGDHHYALLFHKP